MEWSGLVGDTNGSTIAVRAVIFDFFGTLVDYQPDRTRLASPEAHELARSLGFVGGHDTFVQAWDRASRTLEEAARATLREFSMTDAAMAFSTAARLDLAPEDAARLGRAFVGEWRRHVHPVPGVSELIRRLARRATVAVVSNTHDPALVPTLLREMDVLDDIDGVVLSVEHGWRKPHPSIYAAALDHVGCGAEQSVFVGDDHEADYVGPIDAGMSALLIDPRCRHDIPATARLASVLDLASRLDDRPFR